MIEFQGMRGTAGASFNGVSIDIDSPISVITGKTTYAGYFTSIPISPYNYRKNNPTKARVEKTVLAMKTMFDIYSDWGERYQVIIDNDDPVLQKTIAYYKSEQLLKGDE